MHLTTLLTSWTVLATIAGAAPTPGPEHRLQFRTFGEPGCFADNEGVTVILKGDTDPEQCYAFEPNAVKSLWIEYLRPTCHMWVYTDQECREGTVEMGQKTDVCVNAEDHWVGWLFRCGNEHK